MFASTNVFLDFNLPNATTWFYFSLLLAMALFFKFSRLLSVRNLDILTLFLVVPGLLLIQHAKTGNAPGQQAQMVVAANTVAGALGQGLGTPDAWAGLAVANDLVRPPALDWLWLGYLCVLLGTGYFFFRCLVDLTLVQRPALAPNLTLGGSVWLAVALFICLTAVAFRQPDPSRPAPTAMAPPPANPVTQQKLGPEAAPFALARESLPDYTWVTRTLAVACHLLVVIGLVFIGRWHFQDTAAGMAAATFYLILPYTGFFVGQDHVWPAAVIIWAIVFYRWPTLAGVLFGIATSIAYFPALALPLWVSFYWGRGAGRFLLASLLTAALCLSVTGLVLWAQGELENSLRNAFQYGAWQPWRIPPEGTEGFWTGLHWAYRIPLFIAFLTFVCLTPFWPMPKNLAQVMALTAAIFIGIQFWYANQGGLYVLWYLPLLLLLVFRPNLEERRPPLINSDTDWLSRFLRYVRSLVRRVTQKPEAVKMNAE
jgi:hypothetical protein